MGIYLNPGADNFIEARKSKIYVDKSGIISYLNSVAKNLKLKAARAVRDMTQADLAAAVGVSRQTINAIEKGEYNPTINLCRSICKVLGKTLDELFWEE